MEVEHLQHLRPADLAERWAIPTKTLANWRSAGKGPAYIKVGGTVRYTLADVELHEAANRTQAVA